ncbi:MAG: sulfatase family protein [Planctomycetota bacterium]
MNLVLSRSFGMLRAIACVVLMLAMSGRSADAAAERPNFVLIFIDDMGYGDIGPFGSTLNRTPNLDRMAAEGLKLTSFYAAPVCSASRAQLLTGCYAPRVSVPGVFFPAGPKGLNPDELTVADYLHEMGYATMCVGKWHLGDQREFLPTRQGFDGYFGIPYSNDMGRPTRDDGRSVHPLMRNEDVAELLENEGQRRITRAYTEEAVKFIESNRERPFFLYLPHTAMHVPLYPHQDFVGKSKNGTYGDWVEEVDWSVGQVLDTLRRQKLAENTLVLFTSDNGPWASKGKAGGVSGPLRGSKGCTLEGGVREPTIAWWPGRIEAGRSSDGIGGTTDVLPTFVSLAGGDVRDDVKIDGVDLSPLLLGKTDESPRSEWFYYQGTRLQAVRSGDWKLAIAPQSLGMGIKERPDDLRQSSMRLYNLKQEIGEVTNVADQNPEVVARLKKLADGMIADIGSGQPGPGVRPAGAVENPVTLFPSRPRSRRKNAPKPSGKPIDWSKVKAGDVYASASAPAIAGKPFRIECQISGKPTSGVIVAHGGSVVGYSLYIKDGNVVFAVRLKNSVIHRVSSPLAANGQRKVVAALAADGTLSLLLNDGKPVSAEASGLLPSHPQEDLCIGHDAGNPVDDNSPRNRFDGRIQSTTVTVSQ